MNDPTPTPTITVCREGGRGYHIISRAKYDADPGAYVVFEPEHTPATAWPEDVVPTLTPLGDGIFDDMPDEDLRTFIFDKTGVKPHHKLKRENLLTKAREA